MTGGPASWRMSPIFILRHAGMPFEWLAGLGLDDEAVRHVDDWLCHDGPDEPRARAVFDGQRAAARARLHELLRREEIQAAIFLSNPTVYEGMLASVLGRPVTEDRSSVRRAERQLYTYVQRLCAKNETTSTFGPMGYGQCDDGSGLRVSAVPTPRIVALSRWTLEEIARCVAREPELRHDIPWHANLLATQPRGLDDRSVQLLDELREAPGAVTQLGARLGLESAEVVARLRPLVAAGLGWRGLLFPAERISGAEGLRDAILRLPPGQARDRWRDELDALMTLCDQFRDSGAAGRSRLLAEMERRFTEATGVPARRRAGQVYADRLMLFEEAASPFRIAIGRDIAEAIERIVSPALELGLAAGRREQAAYRQAMTKLVEDAGGSLPFTEYAEKGAIQVPAGSGFAEATRLRIAAGPQSEGTVAPDALGPANPDEAYALPDLCLRAPGPAAVTGLPEIVVARMHHHLLLPGWLTTFHDAPAAIEAQVSGWLATGFGQRTLALATSRRNKGFYRWPGRRMLVAPVDHEGRPGGESARDARVVVTADGELTLLDGQGRPAFLYPMLADLTGYPPIAALTPGLVSHPAVEVAEGIPARVLVGKAVLQRRRWELDLSALAEASSPWESFIALRRIALDAGLPRFCFLRVGSERKPYCIDTGSHFAADLVSYLARRDPRARAEEMLPGPDELWLQDERGHYTSELRVQFLRLPGRSPRP
jgi:Lantibiotic dehydratase, N terminus